MQVRQSRSAVGVVGKTSEAGPLRLSCGHHTCNRMNDTVQKSIVTYNLDRLTEILSPVRNVRRC